MKKTKKAPAFVFALLVVVAVSAAALSTEVIDGIEAVVGDYVILKSEVSFQLQLWAMQQNREDFSSEEIDMIRRDVIEQMVNDKLILIKAVRDTSIKVSPEQIEEALDRRLEELKTRFPSQSEFERQMALEGLTYRELKNKFRDEMRNKLYKDMLISRELRKISILPSEVREFYETYRDSLPPHPEIVKLAHILLEVQAGLSTLDSARAKAERIKEMLDNGAEFAELAMRYSDDPSAESGGDLGYFSRGDLFEDIEEIAFGLDIGEVSDVVQTDLGFHLMKCEDKLAGRIRCRHILCSAEASDQDKADAMRVADSLIHAIEQGADFAELAKEYSIDEETRKLGGELDWFVYSELTPEFTVALQDVGVGEVSRPTESQLGIHILKVLDRQESRQWSLEKDLDSLRELVRRQKTELVVGKLVEELRQETYVDIRAD